MLYYFYYRYSVGLCQIFQLQVVVPILSLFLTGKPFLTELREKSSSTSTGFMENQDLYLPTNFANFAKRKNTRKPVGIGPAVMTRSRSIYPSNRDCWNISEGPSPGREGEGSSSQTLSDIEINLLLASGLSVEVYFCSTFYKLIYPLHSTQLAGLKRWVSFFYFVNIFSVRPVGRENSSW